MKPLIIANWKCNPPTLAEAKELFNKVKKTNAIICAPFIYLPELKSDNLCAQNCFWEEKGPYTGEVSPKMLKDLGIEYVIIGHSERRNHFKETDEMINKKVKAALSVELVPILCIGEKKGENANQIVENQLKCDLDGISKEEQERIIVVYEPVWAISTSGGEICSADYAQKMLEFIKQRFSGKIIYGGSVDSKIINNYLKVGYEGALVGGASLKAEEFVNTVKIAE